MKHEPIKTVFSSTITHEPNGEGYDVEVSYALDIEKDVTFTTRLTRIAIAIDALIAGVAMDEGISRKEFQHVLDYCRKQGVTK